jgi:NADH dehydrogenase (ubiquinone) Fe-S protein 6|tara:strand:+ start:145 stop:345 length:201 start_codon:yes stop_codon:yes gene_type:complete
MPASTVPQPEIIMTSNHRVSCDGGGGALGHPKVWLETGEDGVVECGYCDRRFILIGGPADTNSSPK